MSGLSPTAAIAHAAGTVVLSTGDVRIAWYGDSPEPVPRRNDQPYPAPQGRAELRASVAEHAGPGVQADHVVIAPGARQALLLVLAALVDERRPAVLIPAPYWPSYLPLAAIAGAQAVVVPGPTGRIDITALRRAAGPSAGAVLVNSPRNPDGATLDDGQLADLIAWTEAAGLLLIFDQVYRGVPLPGRIAPSPADLPGGLPASCVVVDGLSKSHALAGLRIGWTIAAPTLTGKILGLASHIIGGTSCYAQDVAIAAIGAGPGGRPPGTPRSAGPGGRPVGGVLAANRDYGVTRLAAVRGVTCGVPAGGIFLFPSLGDWLAYQPISPADLAPWLLDRHGLAVVDGAAFGAPGHVRLSYAVEPEQYRAGVDRLCDALTGGSP